LRVEVEPLSSADAEEREVFVEGREVRVEVGEAEGREEVEGRGVECEVGVREDREDEAVGRREKGSMCALGGRYLLFD